MDEVDYMWTTEKDDYCLVKSDSEMGYTIRTTDSISIVLIEDGPLAQETIKQMLNAGCLVFDSSSEWTTYVKSQPGYTDVPWWEQPGAESPFLPKNRPTL